MKQFIVNVPTTRLLVDQTYLGVKENAKLEECYLVAVTSIPSGPLMFTVHLESGAVWQRLPIEALRASENLFPCVTKIGREYDTSELQPFSCLEGDINCIVYDHLKNYEVSALIGEERLLGTYLMTIDVLGQGLASDPVQHKSHNIVVLENGQIAALPNNYVLFKDNYFTNQDKICYKRVDKNYYPGG